MKKIYVCSRLRADANHTMEEHIKFATEHCKEIVKEGNMPIAPHIYFTQFMDDNIENERTLALKFNFDLLKSCDEIYVYDDEGISSGMQAEIDYSNSNGKTIVYFKTKNDNFNN